MPNLGFTRRATVTSDASPPSRPNAPQRRRRSMTQRRAGTNRQNGGDEAGVVRQMAVPDRVDAAVDRMKAALADPVGDVPPREPEAPKLGGGGDPVLPPGHLGQRPVTGCSTFLRIIERKVEHPLRVTRSALQDRRWK